MIDLRAILGEYESEFDKHEPSNFIDITANLLSVANLLTSKGQKIEAERYLEHVKKYLMLLEDFPKFREHELAHNDPKIGGSSIKYIEQKYQELRKAPYK